MKYEVKELPEHIARYSDVEERAKLFYNADPYKAMESYGLFLNEGDFE